MGSFQVVRNDWLRIECTGSATFNKGGVFHSFKFSWKGLKIKNKDFETSIKYLELISVCFP